MTWTTDFHNFPWACQVDNRANIQFDSVPQHFWCGYEPFFTAWSQFLKAALWIALIDVPPDFFGSQLAVALKSQIKILEGNSA